MTVLAQREGFQAPGIEEFEWPNLVDLHLFGIDLGINRVVLQMFLVAFVVWLLFFLAFRTPRLAPAGLQNVMESLIDFTQVWAAASSTSPSMMTMSSYARVMRGTSLRTRASARGPGCGAGRM